jgi:hypothetical protein
MDSVSARARSIHSTRGHINIRLNIDHSNSSTVASLLTCMFSIKSRHSHSNAFLPRYQLKCATSGRAGTSFAGSTYLRVASLLDTSSQPQLRCTSHSHRHSPFCHFFQYLIRLFLHAFTLIPILANIDCMVLLTNAYPTSILKPQHHHASHN